MMNQAVKKEKHAYCPNCGAAAGHTITGEYVEGKARADRRREIQKQYVCLGLPGAGAVKCGWRGTSPHWN